MIGYGELPYGLGPYGLAEAASGHAFDHNAFDSVAFDTDAAVVEQVAGGAPRPFFSYSHERLAWADRPLVPQVIPPIQPPAITGYVAISRTGGSVFAVGKVTFPGAIQTNHQAKRRLSINGMYTPQAIVADSRIGRRFPSSIRAHGDVFDWDLVAAAIMIDAA